MRVINLKKNEKKHKSKKRFIFVVVVILILIAGLVAYFVTKNVKDDENQNENETQENQVVNNSDAEVSLIDMNNTENAKVENGVKENTSSKLVEEKSYSGMTIKDIKLKTEDGISKLTAAIVNESETNFAGERINIVFTKQDGSEYAKLEAALPPVCSHKSNEIDAATTADIANAYDFHIEKIQ